MVQRITRVQNLTETHVCARDPEQGRRRYRRTVGDMGLEIFLDANPERGELTLQTYREHDASDGAYLELDPAIGHQIFERKSSVMPHVFRGTIDASSAVVDPRGSQRYFRLIDHNDHDRVIAESFESETKPFNPYRNAEFILIGSCADVPQPVEE